MLFWSENADKLSLIGVGKKVVWSGSFREGHRVLQLLEEDSIQLRAEEFDLHVHLRERFIPLHRTYHVTAAMAATYMCPISV